MYEGTLVRLRAMEPRDAAAQHRWFADPEVTRWTGWRYPMSRDVLAQRLAERSNGSFASAAFSVERRDTGELVGRVMLRDAHPENRAAELDLVIGERAAWGQGFGTDATRTVCDFGFRQMGLHRVYLWVFLANEAAIRVYEKCGFVREGVARDRFWRDGWHDQLLMARLAEDA